MTRRNPFSAENAGSRRMGVKGGKTIFKPGREFTGDKSYRNEMGKPALVKLSTKELVVRVRTGGADATDATAELHRRGRGPDGVAVAWGPATAGSQSREKVLRKFGAITNPFTMENAGRRMKGSLDHATMQKPDRKAANPRRSPAMVAMSTANLVQAARSGGANAQAALEELKVRGRNAEGVKEAWTASPKYKSDTAAAGRVRQKFETGKGLLKPRYEWPGGDSKAAGARTNRGVFGGDVFGDLLFDLD